jgi:hypothetical protein
MVEVDGFTKDQFRSIWEFLSKDEFWRQNILSTKTLRKHFNKLLLKANKQKLKDDSFSQDMLDIKNIVNGTLK